MSNLNRTVESPITDDPIAKVDNQLAPVSNSTVSVMTELNPTAIASKLPESTVKALDASVDEFMRDLEVAELDSVGLDELERSVRELGDKTVLDTSTASNRLLDMKETAITSTRAGSDSPVAKNLVDFRRVLEDLNPDKRRKFLGLIPFGDQLSDWKRRYESSQDHLDAILDALMKSESDIKLDNQALHLERERLRDQAESLLKVLYVSNQIQDRIHEHVDNLEQTDPSKAVALRTGIESDAVQKGNDLKTHALAMAQNYKALELTINSNTKLARNLHRARTTTITALRGAVLMRNALSEQANISNQVKVTQDMTSDYLVSVSEDVKNNAAEIERQSQGTMLDLEKLRTTYKNILEAATNAEESRLEALANMQEQRKQLEDFAVDNSPNKNLGANVDQSKRRSVGGGLRSIDI